MLPSLSAAAQRMTRYRWLVLALLFAGTSLNYMDRLVFSIIVPAIRAEIPISDLEYGYLTGAFQAGYGIGNLLVGKLIDVVGTRLGYLMALVGWSIAAACHAFSARPLHFGVWRSLLGLGEAGNFPAAGKAIAEWFPRKDRSFAMGICVASTNVAAMAGPPLFVVLNAAFGWRTTFVVVGAAGILVSMLWVIFYKSPEHHTGVNQAERAYITSGDGGASAPPLGWREVIRRRETWGFAFAKFFTDPVWWFYISWLPLYLFDVRKLALSEIGWALPVIYLMADLGSVAGGWLPGRLLKLGLSPGRARKTAMAICVIWMPLAALAVYAPSLPLTVFLISLGTMGHQGWSANLFTCVSDVYPSSEVASVIGVGQSIASVGGVLFSSVLPGILITYFGYTPVFLMLGTFHLIGYAFVHFLMGDLQPIQKR